MRTSRRSRLQALLICLLAPAASAVAQDQAPGNPYSTYNKYMYEGLKGIVLRSAEKVPEESYGFRPTEAVRSFGQVIGHVADSQYSFCSLVRGEKDPEPKIEQTRKSKADLIAALKDAFAYCDKAYDGMTDASGAQMIKLLGNDAPKMGALTVNLAHTAQHYGNLVTYMRLKNIVPPTSEPRPTPAPTK